jgi:hypothetical protein
MIMLNIKGIKDNILENASVLRSYDEIQHKTSL